MMSIEERSQVEQELAVFRESLEAYLGSDCFQRMVQAMQPSCTLESYVPDLVRRCTTGKCIRGYLVALGYQISAEPGDEIPEAVMAACAAYELFEVGILAHDDIIDESPLRRGGPAMHIAHGGGKLGTARAICLGDIAMLMSDALLARAGLPDRVFVQAVSSQGEVFLKTLAGELLDIDMAAASHAGLDDVLDMYRLKTAWYTIVGPLRLGGILGQASGEIDALFEALGDKLGIAFQVHDDILGMFGDSDVMGKSAVSDAEEGKKSVLTAYYDKFADQEERGAFYDVYGHPAIGADGMRFLREELVSSGALTAAACLRDAHAREATDLISRLPDADASRKLLRFARYVVSREL